MEVNKHCNNLQKKILDVHNFLNNKNSLNNGVGFVVFGIKFLFRLISQRSKQIGITNSKIREQKEISKPRLADPISQISIHDHSQKTNTPAEGRSRLQNKQICSSPRFENTTSFYDGTIFH